MTSIECNKKIDIISSFLKIEDKMEKIDEREFHQMYNLSPEVFTLSSARHIGLGPIILIHSGIELNEGRIAVMLKIFYLSFTPTLKLWPSEAESLVYTAGFLLLTGFKL